MNTPKIGSYNQEKFSHQNHGLAYNLGGTTNREFGSQQQPWQMGIITIQSTEIEGEESQQQSYMQANSSGSNTIMDRIGSPATAFYAAEKFLGFSQNDFHYQVNNGINPSFQSQMISKKFDHDILSPYQQSRDSFYTSSFEQGDPGGNFHQSKRCLTGSQYPYSACEKPYKIQCNNILERERILELKRKLFDDFDTSDRRQQQQPSVHYDENQDHGVSQNGYGSQFAHIRQTARPVNSVNCSNSGTVMSSKTRIRWTQDLHDRFVECVNCLGGAEKATPKAILKLMDSEGLTIFHVKSHLQKYRIAKYIPDPAEGKSEKRTSAINVEQLDNKTGMQIKDALQMQLAVQRQLHEQLEIQRNLQLRIEEQGRQLKKMFDRHQQQKSNKTPSDAQNPDNMISDEPSTCDEDVQVLNLEDCENTLFPSKIS